MTEHELKLRFPRASQDFIKANRVRPAEPEQAPRQTLVDPLPGETQNRGRIDVRYRIFRVRFLDEENLNGSTKPVTDCLVQAGLLPNDDPKTVKITVEQERVCHYFEERTEIEITY